MGNCVSPPAPPSIPPEHPFLLGRVPSSHPAPFGFWEKPPCQAPLLEPSRFSLGRAALTTRGVPSEASPGEELREIPGDCGAFALGWASGHEAPGLLGEGEGSREKRRSRTLDRQEPNTRSSLTRQAAFFSKEDNSPRSPARCDALGRRAREAVPDSRAEVSGAKGPKARKAPANKGGVIWWSLAK